MQPKRVCFELEKVRGGYLCEVEALDNDGETMYDKNSDPITDKFLIKADEITADELGKQVMASLVALRMENTPAKKR